MGPDQPSGSPPGGSTTVSESGGIIEVVRLERVPHVRTDEKQPSVSVIKEETVRAALAIALLFVLAVVILLAWISSRSSQWGQAKEWLDTVLPAVTALLGSATGYYYGSRQSG